jgi:hypothetical protein
MSLALDTIVTVAAAGTAVSTDQDLVVPRPALNTGVRTSDVGRIVAVTEVDPRHVARTGDREAVSSAAVAGRQRRARVGEHDAISRLNDLDRVDLAWRRRVGGLRPGIGVAHAHRRRVRSRGRADHERESGDRAAQQP